MKLKERYFEQHFRDFYQLGSRVGRRDAKRGRTPRGAWLGTCLQGRDVSFFVLGYRSGYRFMNAALRGAS